MESIRLQCRCEIQIVDRTCKISRQRIDLLHFPHHNGLACRPIPCLFFFSKNTSTHEIPKSFHWRDIVHISINKSGMQYHIFFFADIDFQTKFKVMSQTHCSKSKKLQVCECRFIPLFVTTVVSLILCGLIRHLANHCLRKFAL